MTTASTSEQQTGTAHGAGDTEHDADAVRIVAAGIDNLYASVAGELDSAAMTAARAARYRAAECGDAEPVEIAGRTFLLSPRTERGYSIRLTAPTMDVWAEFVGRDERPSLLIELRSLGIHMAGIEAMVEEAHAVAAHFCPGLSNLAPGDGMKVSRIDLYCDLQGWEPCRADDDRWVTRARSVGDHDGEMIDSTPRTRRRGGRTFSGFEFGKGRVRARVYHKTLQMASKGQDWMHQVWHGVDPAKPVWRVEVQLRRGILRDFTVGSEGDPLSTVRDALDRRQAIWRYAVCDWLTLRVLTPEDSHRYRWPIDPVWRVVQAVEIGSPCSELVRVRQEAAAHDVLVQGLTGYLTSLLAHRKNTQLRRTIGTIDAAMATGTAEDIERAIRMALEGMTPAVRAYCDRRQRRFLGLVEQKVQHNVTGLTVSARTEGRRDI